jgi:hypothetical protein
MLTTIGTLDLAIVPAGGEVDTAKVSWLGSVTSAQPRDTMVNPALVRIASAA